MNEDRSPWFWPALVVGWGVMAVGIVGMVAERDRTAPLKLVRYVVGFLLVHDLVVAPIAVVVGLLVARFVPAVVRGPLRGALALTALVVVFAWPLLRRYGEHATNDSALPLDYGRTVPVVLAVVWVVAAGALVARLVTERRRAGRR